MKTKKQIKKQKAEIVAESAREIGYSVRVINKFPAYAVLAAVRSIAESSALIGVNDADLENYFITEAVKAVNYKDFKDVAIYFLNYNKEF